MTNLRFIAVDDPGAVTVGELRATDPELGVILEHGQPRVVLRLSDLPQEAADTDLLSAYLEPMGQLQPTGFVAAAEAAEWVAFEPQLAVIVHERVPFVLLAHSPLLTVNDVDSLVGSTEVTAFAASARLPGRPEPIPPGVRRCRCPVGHKVNVPPGQHVTACPRDGLPIKC